MSDLTWIDDWEDHTTRCGDDEFCFWWEDMRPREVHERIHDAYEAGYRRRCAEQAAAAHEIAELLSGPSGPGGEP